MKSDMVTFFYKGFSILDNSTTVIHYSKLVHTVFGALEKECELTFTLKDHPVVRPQLLDFLFCLYIVDTYFTLNLAVDMNRSYLTKAQVEYLTQYFSVLADNESFEDRLSNFVLDKKVTKHSGKRGILWSGGKDSYYLMTKVEPSLPTYRVCPTNAEYIMTPPFNAYISAASDYTLHLTGLDFAFCGLDQRCSFLFSTAYVYLLACGVEPVLGFTYEDLEPAQVGVQTTLTTSKLWIKKFGLACGGKVHTPMEKTHVWRIIAKLTQEELESLSCCFGTYCGRCETCYMIARIRTEKNLKTPVKILNSLKNKTWESEWNTSIQDPDYYSKLAPWFSIAVRNYVKDNQ